MTNCGDSDGPLTIADATTSQGRIQLAETIEDHTQGPNLVVTSIWIPEAVAFV